METLIRWLITLWRLFFPVTPGAEKTIVEYTQLTTSTRLPFSYFMVTFGGRGSNYLARLRYSQYLGFKNALSLERIRGL